MARRPLLKLSLAKRFLPSLYQDANASASPKYVKFPLFFKKNSSFLIYDVLLSYHTKQLHNYKNCYAYVIMDF